jgi:hypothetical protein
MKLLSILPIASVVGLVALGKGLPTPQPGMLQSDAVGYIGIFSGLFTLALFGYEMRGLLMCHDFSLAGAELEKEMGIPGQFTHCSEERNFPCYDGRYKRPIALLVNDKSTSVAVYSLVFGAWFFVGLRYAFDIHPTKCIVAAVTLAALVAGLSSWFLHALTKKPATSNNQ